MLQFDAAFSSADLKATLDGLGREVSFLQIGAMDGVSYDPVSPFVRKNGWHGTLVEPMPDMFETLKANYAGCDGLSFINGAVADYDGTIEMTRIDPEAFEKGLLSRAFLGLSTLMPDRGVMSQLQQLPPDLQMNAERHKRTIEVPCFTLATLLAKENIQKIDVFIVDTEGADWMITRQLDLKAYRPRLVYIEYNHLSSYEQIACANHFHNHGYRIFIEENVRENFLAIAG